MGENRDRPMKLYVSGFPKMTSKKDLLKTFSKYGYVSCIFLPNESFCFIKFTRNKDAMKALEAACISKIKLHGEILSVKFALPKNGKKKQNKETNIKYATKKEKISGPTLIDKLNDDCLVQIFLYLPIEKRLKLEKVCVRWQNVSKKAWYDIRELKFDEECRLSNGLCPKSKFIEEVLMRCGVYLKSLHLTDVCSSYMLQVICKYCYNLTAIEIGFTSFCVKYTKNLSNLKKLNSFTLMLADSDFLINCLQNLSRKVKSINLESKHFATYQDFPHMFDKFDVLDSLRLGDYTLGMDLMKRLCTKQMITHLDLSLCKIEKGLIFISDLKNLELLVLKEVDAVNDNFLAVVSTKCQKLRSLDVSWCKQLSDEGIRELKKLANLESLKMKCMENSVTDLPIGQLKKIKKLQCWNCWGVRDQGIMQLIQNCPHLETLDVRNTSITPNTLRLAVSVTKYRKNSIILSIAACRMSFNAYQENDSPFLKIILW